MVSGARRASTTARAIFGGADDGRGHQQAAQAVLGEHLRLAQPGGAGPDRAGGHEPARHLGALVGLAVRPEGLAALAEVGGHPGDVGLEAIEIEQQGGGGNLVTRAHRSVIVAERRPVLPDGEPKGLRATLRRCSEGRAFRSASPPINTCCPYHPPLHGW